MREVLFSFFVAVVVAIGIPFTYAAILGLRRFTGDRHRRDNQLSVTEDLLQFLKPIRNTMIVVGLAIGVFLGALFVTEHELFALNTLVFLGTYFVVIVAMPILTEDLLRRKLTKG